MDLAHRLARPIGPASAVCVAASILIVTAWAQAPPTGQEPGKDAAGKVDPSINAQFHKKENVRRFIKSFESEDREVFARRREIVGVLGLRPGQSAADIGAGSGLFTRLMAEEVGPEGRVYAVDVSKDFLEHIARQADKDKQPQIAPVMGSQDSTNLEAGSIDLAFICDVYHHFEHPDRTLASIHKALRPGGSLVLIEFDRIEGKSSAFVLKHVRAGRDQFFREIEAAGFARDASAPTPKLKENVFARFRKVDAPTAKPAQPDASKP